MADSDFDAQDTAEVFDETLTDGDETADSDGLDLRPDTYDATSALGDEDLTGVDDALDADEEDDELLDSLEDGDTPDEDDDDLVDRDDLASDPLADDDLPLTSDDRDVPDADDIDGVDAAPASDASIVTVPDIDNIAGPSVADLESDGLSDADLEDLDYKD